MNFVPLLKFNEVGLFPFQSIYLLFRKADEIVRICLVIGIYGIKRAGSQAKDLSLPGSLIEGLPDCNVMVSEPIPISRNEISPVGLRKSAIYKLEAFKVTIELRFVFIKLIPIIVDLLDIARGLPDHLDALNLCYNIGKYKSIRLASDKEKQQGG
jgi:hypothetical protein